jgi:nucleoid-associated protein YgaU
MIIHRFCMRPRKESTSFFRRPLFCPEARIGIKNENRSEQISLKNMEQKMGLFDFVKNIGNKLFTNESQAAQKLQEAIQANNPGVKNLKVDYKNATAYISGEADNPEALQKAVLIAGNTQGVEAVNIDGMKVAVGGASPSAIETFGETEYYIIKSGDTLSKIAQHY